LFGDGSGSNWRLAAGWACVSIERLTMERVIYRGSVNRGTVNFVELMAYVQALDCLSGREADLKANGGPTRAFHVHIITDSDYCRTLGSTEQRNGLKNAGLWSVLDAYARHGFILRWHHVRGHTEGEGCALNKYVDALSKAERKSRKAAPAAQVEELKTVYDVNPSEEEPSN